MAFGPGLALVWPYISFSLTTNAVSPRLCDLDSNDTACRDMDQPRTEAFRCPVNGVEMSMSVRSAGRWEYYYYYQASYNIRA